MKSILALLLVALIAGAFAAPLVVPAKDFPTEKELKDGGSCDCSLGICMCCTDVQLSILEFELCANVTFDQTAQIVIVEAIINNVPIVGLEFSENSQQCFTWKIVDVCLQLADFQTTSTSECGCIAVSADVAGLDFGPFPIGCFQINGPCS